MSNSVWESRVAPPVAAASTGPSGDKRGATGITVRTPLPLDAAEQQQLMDVLAQRFGAEQPVVFEVQPQLLGGVWLRIGDRILDGSLRGRLEALRKQLK